MKTFKLLLIFLIGIPFFGSKYIIYILLLVLCIPDYKYLSIKKSLMIFYILIIPMLLCEVYVFKEAPITSLSIFISMVIGSSIREININSIKVVLTIIILFHLFSFYSIINYGYDLLPEYLHGESKHLVGINSLIQIRPSGIYSEPSTLSIHYIAISVFIFLKKESYKHKTLIISLATLFSLLTFSIISLVSILIIIVNYRKLLLASIYKLIIATGLSFSIYNFVIKFVIPKVELYTNNGLDNYKRSELFFLMIENIGFTPVNYTKLGVALDNGPIIYLMLFCGIYSLPLIFFILKKSKNNTELLLLLITKISITYPLFWFILTSNEKNKSSNSN